MKPVEIEFLMKDGLSKGVDKSRKGIEQLLNASRRIGEVLSRSWEEGAQASDKYKSKLSGLRQGVEKMYSSLKTMGVSEKETAGVLMKSCEQNVKFVEAQTTRLSALEGTLRSALESGNTALADSTKREMKTVETWINESLNAIQKNAELIPAIVKNASTKVPEQQTGSMRAQLKLLTTEIAQTTLEYHRMTDAERNSAAGMGLKRKLEDLVKKAGELRDAMDDANRQIRGEASDTKNFDAIAQGLNVVVSSAGAAASVSQMFGAKQEDLINIQTKLQATLAISNALSVIQNNLQEESSLMLGIRTIQEKAQAAAIGIRTAAEGKGVVVTKLATVAQAAFNLVAKANPYVLLATALITVVGALAAFTIGANKAKREEEELAKAQEEAAERAKEARDAFVNASVSSMETASRISNLQTAYRKANSEMEKTAVLKQAQTEFKKLGLECKTLTDTQNILVKNGDAVVKMLRLQGTVAALSSLRMEAYKKSYSMLLENGYGVEGAAALAGSNADVVALDKQIANYSTQASTIKSQLTKDNGGSGGGGKKDPTATRNAKSLQEEWKHQEQMSDLEQKAVRAREDALIAAEQNAAVRERKQQETDYQRKIQDLKTQEDEIYKTIYEQRRKQWELNHKDSPYENTEKGKKGYLSDDAQSAMRESFNKKGHEDEKKQFDTYMEYIAAKEQQEIANYAKILDKRRKQENQATNDFLKTWGDYNQKKLAITAEYNEKISQASSPTEAASLTLQRDAELKNLEAEKLKDSIDWEGVFSELSGHTEEYLEGLRDQLQGLLSSGQVTDVTQMETIQEKIREINDQLNQQGGMFHYMSDAQREHIRLVQASKDAQDALNEAKAQELAAQMAVFTQEQKIRDYLESMGVDRDTDLDNGLVDMFGADTEAGKKLAAMLKDLGVAQGNLTKSTEKTAKRTFEWKKAEDAANESLEDAIARVAGNIAGWCNEYLSDLPNLLNSIGLGSAGEKVSQGLSAVNNAAGAAADFASGNYVGAAFKAVSAVQDIGRVIGIGGGNEAEVAETTERLTKANELLADRVSDLTEVMSKQTGAKAINTYETALNAQEEINKNSMEILKAQMGYHSSHHSNAYYAEDNKIRSYNADAQKAFKAAGVQASTITGLSSIYNLTPEQLRAIKDFAPDLWNYLTTVGKYDKSEYWENVVEQAGKTAELTEQIRESLTTTTEENVFSGFLDDLNALASGSETVFDDIADNWQEMVNKMVVNNLVGANFQESLKAWYGKLADTMEKHTNSGDTTGLQSELDALKDEYNNYVQSAGREIEALRQMGIIKATEENSGVAQSGKTVAFTTMSHDQGTKLEGLFVSGQVHWSSMDDKMTDVSVQIGAAGDTLKRIEENTGSSAQLLGEIKEEFKKMTRDGLKIR